LANAKSQMLVFPSCHPVSPRSLVSYSHQPSGLSHWLFVKGISGQLTHRLKKSISSGSWSAICSPCIPSIQYYTHKSHWDKPGTLSSHWSRTWVKPSEGQYFVMVRVTFFITTGKLRGVS